MTETSCVILAPEPRQGSMTGGGIPRGLAVTLVPLVPE
jgi:hypothetical protein